MLKNNQELLNKITKTNVYDARGGKSKNKEVTYSNTLLVLFKLV